MRELTVDIANEALVLMPERAVLWRRAHTLIVADAHWGRSVLAGQDAAAAAAATEQALNRLQAMLVRTGAHRVVFLGDLLHVGNGNLPPALALVHAWRKRYREVDLLLVRGNQDRSVAGPPGELSIRTTDGPLIEPPFVLTHFPAPSAAGYVLAGRLHPMARVRRGGEEARRACFWFGRRVGVLPAFGDGVGLSTIEPAAGDRVYVIEADAVHTLGAG